MSKAVLLLKDEATSAGGGRQPQAMDNAVRLALLVTRSFVTFLSDALSKSSHEDVLQLVSLLQLSDVFVKLGQNGSPEAAQNNGGALIFTLHEMDIISPKNQVREEQQQQHPTPKQILGRLLYSIFSMGQSPPSDLFVAGTSISPQPSNGAGGTGGANRSSSKSFRSAETSLFSELIEAKLFPVPACRLLSDLIDIGPDGKADSPARSFEEVIQDLEQMMSQPQIFLHDPYYPQGVPPPPIFGQVFHGRKEEITTLLKTAVQIENEDDESAKFGVESIFVSGIAGSGKSVLVHTVANHLDSRGWMVIKAKFERSTEHASRGIISAMFDSVISHLARKKEGGVPSDVEYVQRVSQAMSESIKHDGLSRLVPFLPSLPRLFDDIKCSSSPMEIEAAEIGNWKLIYSLTKLLEAVLEQDRFIMICCDDLQWADKQSLSLISEVLVNIGGIKRIRHHCLFVGLFREEEVEMTPFSIQYTYLQTSSHINSSEIKLPGLSKDVMVDMMTEEFRLPKRYVRELADIVFKKTAGHALFAVELLNSFIRGSIIAYKSDKRRFAWDLIRLDCIQTGGSAAKLIASKFSSLPSESQRLLRILSCFGIQMDRNLLQVLETFQEGIISLDDYIDMGILDRAGPLVMFAHDLIQQAVYESVSLTDRQALHLELGEFLGALATEGGSPSISPVLEGLGQLQLTDDQVFYAGKSMTSSLISLACDQINAAGSGAINDEDQKQKYAKWNLAAGKQTLKQSDFGVAYYYFSNGIPFLGEDCWSSDSARLCLKLHEGAAMASFALGNGDRILRHAEMVVNHASFQDALEVQQIVLRTLMHSGKHEECILRGLEVLRRLNVDIPARPAPESIMTAFMSTDNIASNFSKEQMLALCETNVDDSVHGVVKVMGVIILSCVGSSSPFLALVSCSMIQHSLQHGICPESSVAFAAFAMLKIFLREDYDGARYWANMVLEMEAKHQSINSSSMKLETHAPLILVRRELLEKPKAA